MSIQPTVQPTIYLLNQLSDQLPHTPLYLRDTSPAQSASPSCAPSKAGRPGRRQGEGSPSYPHSPVATHPLDLAPEAGTSADGEVRHLIPHMHSIRSLFC